MILTIVRMQRDECRSGFVVAANTVEEFVRKVRPIAEVAPSDTRWKCYPCPEGTDPAMASRKTI